MRVGLIVDENNVEEKILELVFGQTKQARGCRRFLLRRLESMPTDLHRPQQSQAQEGSPSSSLSGHAQL
jgi:hypothetical protein